MFPVTFDLGATILGKPVGKKWAGSDFHVIEKTPSGLKAGNEKGEMFPHLFPVVWAGAFSVLPRKKGWKRFCFQETRCRFLYT